MWGKVLWRGPWLNSLLSAYDRTLGLSWMDQTFLKELVAGKSREEMAPKHRKEAVFL